MEKREEQADGLVCMHIYFQHNRNFTDNLSAVLPEEQRKKNKDIKAAKAFKKKVVARFVWGNSIDNKLQYSIEFLKKSDIISALLPSKFSLSNRQPFFCFGFSRILQELN